MGFFNTRDARLALLIGTVLCGALLPAQTPAQTPSFDTALRRVQERPADAERSFELSRAAASAQHYAVAISALERILILDPGLNNIRLELGVLYLRTGNTALAEEFIAEAIRDPQAPPAVVERAQEFLTVARRAANPTRFEGFSRVILGHQSNPEGLETGARSDGFAALVLNGTLRHDLGFQAGHEAVLSATLFSRLYGRTRAEDLNRLALSGGIDFYLGGGGGMPVKLETRLNAAVLEKDGARFQTDLGLSLNASFRPSERVIQTVRLSYTDQDFSATAAEPANPLKSGDLIAIGTGVRIALEGGRVLAFNLDAAQRKSQAAHQSYDEVAVSAAYLMPVNREAKAGAWTLGVDLSYAERRYDAVPPALAGVVGAAQRDRTISAAISLEAPVSEKDAVIVRLAPVDVSSNFAGKSKKEVEMSLSWARRF